MAHIFAALSNCEDEGGKKVAQTARRFANVEERLTWDPPLRVPFTEGERRLSELDLEELGIEVKPAKGGCSIRFNDPVEVLGSILRPGTWIDIEAGCVISLDDRTITYRP